MARILTPSTLLAGPRASLRELSGRPAPRCLHIATHGQYRGDAPVMSGVRLADGWLRAADFCSLSLTGSLVVLSGCETGLSSPEAGQEVQGLVRGIFAAGAAEIVASLWRVDDETTTRLMSRFHQFRKGGASSGVALAKAQAEMAAEGLHPWFWAGFVASSRILRGPGLSLPGPCCVSSPPRLSPRRRGLGAAWWSGRRGSIRAA